MESENKQNKLIEKEISLLVTRVGVEGELDEDGQKVQNSSYKINKYRGCDVQHGNDN